MKPWIAVVVGGAVGTALRLAIDTALPHGDDAFPWSTLLINLTGALALGWLVGGLWTRPATPAWLKAGVGAGVIGSYTTMSAVLASAVTMAAHGVWWLSAAWLLVSAVGGPLLGAVGLRVGARLGHRPLPGGVTDGEDL